MIQKAIKADPPFYGILLEDEKQMAKETVHIAVIRKLQPGNVEEEAFLTMAVFEYLIGNTDWSVQYLQNIKLMATDSAAVATAVPTILIIAGIVNAPLCKTCRRVTNEFCASDGGTVVIVSQI